MYEIVAVVVAIVMAASFQLPNALELLTVKEDPDSQSVTAHAEYPRLARVVVPADPTLIPRIPTYIIESVGTFAGCNFEADAQS